MRLCEIQTCFPRMRRPDTSEQAPDTREEEEKRIDSMDSHADVGCDSRFDAPVTRWTDIPI